MSNTKYQISQFFKHKCAVWEFTLKCNSRCIHCGSSAGKPRENELNTQESLDLIRDLKSCGYDGIALMGGEPFLRNDWYEVAHEIKKHKMKLSIISNGLEILDTIPKLKKLDIDCVSLSLDGALPKTHDYIRGIKGAFQKVIRTIKILKKEKIPVSLITTVNKINFKDLNLIRDFLLNKMIPWQIQIALPIGRFSHELVISKEQFYAIGMFISFNMKKYSIRELPLIGAHCFGYFSEFLPELGLEPWIGCQAGKSVLGILSDGNIKGCLTLSDDYIEGNFRKDSIYDILNSRFDLKCNQYKQVKNSNDYCNTCDKIKKCNRGCLGTRNALKSYENPYCFRAIEKSIFKQNSLPFRWRIDSKISRYKYLYKKILLNPF